MRPLVSRGEGRTIDERFVCRMLETSPTHAVVDAARSMASPDLLPALLVLRDRGWAGSEADARLLEAAIAACQPVVRR